MARARRAASPSSSSCCCCCCSAPAPLPAATQPPLRLASLPRPPGRRSARSPPPANLNRSTFPSVSVCCPTSHGQYVGLLCLRGTRRRESRTLHTVLLRCVRRDDFSGALPGTHRAGSPRSLRGALALRAPSAIWTRLASPKRSNSREKRLGPGGLFPRECRERHAREEVFAVTPTSSLTLRRRVTPRGSLSSAGAPRAIRVCTHPPPTLRA